MLQLDYERKRCMPLCQLALVLVQLSCLRLLISDLIMKHLQRNKAQPAEIMAPQKGTVFILILCLTLPASRLVTGEQVRSMLTRSAITPQHIAVRLRSTDFCVVRT